MDFPLHFNLAAFPRTPGSIPRLPRTLSQSIWAAGQSGQESRYRVSRLVQKPRGLEICKGGIWSRPGVFSPTHPQISSEIRCWWQTSHIPPFLNWSVKTCASAWQKGLPFRAGTWQSLRVWWKNEMVLMEPPYGSEHSLEGIEVELAHILLKHHKCKLFLLVCN